MPNLEQQLGEISGQLKALVPTIQSLDARVREVESQVSAATIRLEGLRTDLHEHKEKSDIAIKQLSTKTQGLRDSMRTLNDQVARIIKKSDGTSQKVWEIVKLILAAGIGAGASFIGRKP